MKTLVVAPHPDDEILGCGGTLLHRRAQGGTLAWLIVTGISERSGWLEKVVLQRDSEIATVAELVGFKEVFNLRLATAQLDKVPMGELIDKLSGAFRSFEPDEVLLPNPTDAHSDHEIVFRAASACTKWFRYPFVRRVLAYETISETDAALNFTSGFHPNVFVNISDYLERKLGIMAVYKSEVGTFPFPRSLEAIKAQAILRGATAGFMAAEAFQLLRERQ